MLNKYPSITTIAVNDIENAVDFYGNILGLESVEEHAAGHVFASGGGSLIGLHQSPTAGTSQGTCAWWIVDDVEAVVGQLKERGITFDENYDLPHAQRSGDVYHLDDDRRAAWFQDPDGNILGVGNF